MRIDNEREFFAFLIGMIIGMILIGVFLRMQDQNALIRNQLHTCYERQEVSIERCNQLHKTVIEWREVTR